MRFLENDKESTDVKIKKNCPFVAFFDPMSFTLCRAFDSLSFNPLSFDPVSFNPLSFDPVSFDPLSVNRFLNQTPNTIFMF